jgi:hypothetical protein
MDTTQADQLARLSQLMSEAHQAIDIPRHTPVTYCLTCGAEIIEADWVVCPCGYSTPLSLHRANVLSANRDRLLTMADLIGVLQQAGLPIDRNRINYLIRKHGLPREKVTETVWRNSRLVERETWGYKVGDVMDLQHQLDDASPAGAGCVEEAA